MKIIRDIRKMNRLAQKLRQSGKVIGFVPTMGALHAGHLSLIQAARRRTEVVVLSIFVNPIQFTQAEDLRKYPQNAKEDLKKSQQAGVDILFMPSLSQVYPKAHGTYVVSERLTQALCGPYRPGHFRGVTTVLAKFFHVVCPHMAFFGRKDYQQALVVEQMVRDLNLDLRIVTLPTIREADGLAVSSRNANLLPQQRQAARVLYRSLLKAKEMLYCGESKASKIRARMMDCITAEPLVRIEYLEICHPQTLEQMGEIDGRVLVALALWIGKVRLIDNLVLRVKKY